MSSYNDLLNEYKKVFNDKETLRAFLFELCNDKGIDLYMDKDLEADKEVKELFIKGVEKLCLNDPLNYVLGYSYFYGYKMTVNQNVLIPRFETEELVGLILSKYDEYYKGQKIDLADVGTGSGAIAIALKKEEDNLNVCASDISFEALEVAKLNAKNNDADIRFLQGSMLDPYIENNIKLVEFIDNKLGLIVDDLKLNKDLVKNKFIIKNVGCFVNGNKETNVVLKLKKYTLNVKFKGFDFGSGCEYKEVLFGYDDNLIKEL